jgi:hypothetical protein
VILYKRPCSCAPTSKIKSWLSMLDGGKGRFKIVANRSTQHL